MRKYPLLIALLATVISSSAQEVLHLQNGASITIQNGAEVSLMGGIGLDNGSSLTNNGTLRLKNNSVANQSDWRDKSTLGALSGTGLVIFNSTHDHNFAGATRFYAVRIDGGGLSLQNDLSISNTLQLTKGTVNTDTYYVSLHDDNASSLLNDATNAAYANSWINGNFRRMITGNTSIYDFPVGNSTRCNLLQFFNNDISGTNYLTASFGPKPGNDDGLNVIENSVVYTTVNNGGVWYLVPDAPPSGGNYALQLYFNGFGGLADNQFGILRRDDASSNATDWMVPAESSLEADNGLGRRLSDGFARRKNISTFSQFGIGEIQPASAPTVTINQAIGQADPTNASPIHFTVEFSDPVSAFTSEDVILSGSAGATTALVTGAGTTYNVAVTGMVQSGTVTATIPANAAYNAEATWNSASTSFDNTVTYNLSSPPIGLPAVSISDGIVYESEGMAVLTISLSHITTLQTKISYATADGTAGSTKKDKDYKSVANKSIAIPPGALSATILIQVYADAITENHENFFVHLSKPTNCVLGDATATVTIIDGGSTSLARIATNMERESFSGEETESQFEVKVYPNPSQTDFILDIISKDKAEASVRVINSVGQALENLTINEKTIRMGQEWKPGMYIVDIVQGLNRKTIKLIKY